MARLGKFRVLVVGSDSVLSKRYEDALRDQFEVVILPSGAAAKQLLESEVFDLLICDQDTPEGLEVLEYSHRLQPRARRVVLGNLSAPEPLLWTVSHGHAERYLCKPVSSGAVLRCAEQLMEQQDSGRSGWLLCGASALLSDVADQMRQQGESVSTSAMTETATTALATTAPATIPTSFEADTVLLLAPDDGEQIRAVATTLSRSHQGKSLLVAVDRENTDLATTALLEGAMDVIFLPIQVGELVRRAALRKNCHSWRDETRRLRQELARHGQEPSLVGSSPPMRTVYAAIERVARVEGDVLLQGEAGTGKALIAKALHHTSKRSGIFVALRLADLAASEMETAIFGGAMSEGATLFIDGIEKLELRLQDRLLRERLSAELGSSRCRLIVGASSDLDAAVSSGALISALRDHLKALVISVPALRDRGEDIPKLAGHFVAEHSERLQRSGVTLGRGAMAELCGYDWPGNVSELMAVVGHAVEMARENSEIASGMLSRSGHPIVEQVVDDIIGGGRGLDAAMAELEAAVIAQALEQHQGNRSAAARQLKLPRQTLQDRMKKHGLWSS